MQTTFATPEGGFFPKTSQNFENNPIMVIVAIALLIALIVGSVKIWNYLSENHDLDTFEKLGVIAAVWAIVLLICKFIG